MHGARIAHRSIEDLSTLSSSLVIGTIHGEECDQESAQLAAQVVVLGTVFPTQVDERGRNDGSHSVLQAFLITFRNESRDISQSSGDDLPHRDFTFLREVIDES